MAEEYTLTKMIESLSRFFTSKDFSTEPYSKRLYNVRLPLYCERPKDAQKASEIEEQIVVDIITESHVSKNAYMPDKHFDSEFRVLNASSVKFFQYYLPEAKIFWAYGNYVEKGEDFDKFFQTCEENGIGLLEVYDDKVEKVLESLSLKEILQKRVETEISKMKVQDTSITNAVSKIIADHQIEYIQYLVFYGEPRFTRRAITEREEDLSFFLSMLLTNRLEGLQHVSYAEQLRTFTREYRYESTNDHQIAYKLIQKLWKGRFGVDYPDIHKDFEVVLLLDPNYRDHFLHQFQVFLLGTLIIDKLYNEAWIKNFETQNKTRIEDAWLACSTYHDYNYPIQKWDDWMKRFLGQNFHVNDSSSKRHLDHEDIGKEIMRLNLGEIVIRDEFVAKMERLSNGIGCDYDDNFQRFVLQRIAVEKNHAVLGALTFLEILQKANNLSQSAINLAAGSILLHDEPNWQCFRGDTKALLECNHKDSLSIEETELSKNPCLTHLTLDSMPLAFLLAFCDVAQEWGRKGRDFEIEKPMLEDIRIDGSNILVYISVLNDSSYEQKEQEIVRLGRFLNDNRFAVRVSSREGQRDSTTKMSGT